MNTRNAFHGLDENLQALVPTMSSTPTLKFESKKSSMMGSRSKSLLEEDDYFKANLPPTYDMQPQKPPQGLSEEESTVLGLMNDKCSRGYENMVKDLSKAASIIPTEEPTTNLVTPYRYLHFSVFLAYKMRLNLDNFEGKYSANFWMSGI